MVRHIISILNAAGAAELVEWDSEDGRLLFSESKLIEIAEGFSIIVEDIRLEKNTVWANLKAVTHDGSIPKEATKNFQQALEKIQYIDFVKVDLYKYQLRIDLEEFDKQPEII